MTYHRSVVLVGIAKGQIDSEINHEQKTDGQNYQISVKVFVGHCHVEAQSHPVGDADDHIILVWNSFFEFIDVLSKIGGVKENEFDYYQKTTEKSKEQRKCAQRVILCVLRIRVIEV